MSLPAALDFHSNKTEISLSVPGKTFLLGEYLALFGGPSLIAATAPVFTLRVKKAQVDAQGSGLSDLPFSPASPAGLFMSSRPDLFSKLNIEFRDPHGGLGGLGASSAQFALLYMYAHPDFAKAISGREQAIGHGVDLAAARVSGGVSGRFPGETQINWSSLLKTYREFAWSGEGTPPSGADVVAQLAGGLSWFDGEAYQQKSHVWSFPVLDFTLLRTGVKLATHEHLKSAQSPLTVARQILLREAVEGATAALESRDEALFCSSLMRFASELKTAGLVAPKTAHILQELERASFTRAVKGCGAMGADIILLLHDRNDRTQVEKWARENTTGEAFAVCGTSDELAPGLRIHHSTEKF